MGVYKEGLLLEGSVSFLPSPLPLPLLPSHFFPFLIMSSSEMNDSIFFDSGLPPPTNDNGYNFPGAWEGYSLWQKYLMSKNCESAELAQQRVEEHAHLLNNLLSSFLELQSEFRAYRDHNPCQTCSRLRGDDSRARGPSQPPPPPVSGRRGRVIFRRPKRLSPPSSSDSLPPLVSQSRERSFSPVHSALFRVRFRSSVSFSLIFVLWCMRDANIRFVGTYPWNQFSGRIFPRKILLIGTG